jgi:hypothetical protein
MKMLVISSSGDSLPLCLQLQEEGVDVSVYIHNPAFQANYDGMVKQKITSVGDLKKFLKDADVDDTMIVFDMTRAYHEDDEEDVEFLDLRKVRPETARSPNLFGLTADYFVEKMGFQVIGNCSWGENAEMDRKRGKVIAGQVGLEIPKHVVAQSLSGAIQVMKSRFAGKRVVLKPFGNHHLDCTYIEKFTGELLEKLTSPWSERLIWPAIIEEYIDGVTLDEEIWFDGREFVQSTLNSTLERKRFGVGDTGPNVGSSLNLVWMKRRPLVNWQRLQHSLYKNHYVGPINATLQICGRTGKAYFLEWSCRFGYDAIFGFTKLMKPSLGEFMTRGFQGGFLDESFASTVRVSIPPYPYEDDTLRKVYAEGTPVTPDTATASRDVRFLDVRQGKTRLECAGADGIICVAVGIGDTIKDAFMGSHRWISRTKIAADVQYRTDWEELARDFRTYVPKDQGPVQ